MGSSLLFYEDLLKGVYDPFQSPPKAFDCSTDVWKDQPNVRGVIFYSVITPIVCLFGICSNTLSLMVLKSKELSGSVYTYLTGVIFYSVITPIVCLFGICSNTLSLMVLKSKELSGSVYTYLTVLVAMDLLMSIVILLGGLSRGIFYYDGWAIYDALVGLPISGIINTWCVMATVGVTIDRVLYLWKPNQCYKPKFCNQNIARKLMVIGGFIAVVSNIPYCFIFNRKRGGKLVTSHFFHSKAYAVFNWFMLVVFDLVPAAVIILGNGFLIIFLQKTRQMGLRCKSKHRDHKSLTITLIAITLLFLISEIPSSLVSRTKAVTVLFRGNAEKGNTTALEVFRQISTLLGALNITMNFLLYCLFCPPYCRVLAKMLKRNNNPLTKKVQVSLFVVNSQNNNDNIKKTKLFHISKEKMESSSFYNAYKTDLKSSRRTEEAEYVDIIDVSKVSENKI